MQIVRYKTNTNTSYGALEGTHIVEYSGTPWGPFRRGRRRVPLRRAVLLAPTVPSKIIGVELNHRGDLAHTGLAEPRFFLKPPTTLIGPDDPIVYPALSVHVEHRPRSCCLRRRPSTRRSRHLRDSQGARALAAETNRHC